MSKQHDDIVKRLWRIAWMLKLLLVRAATEWHALERISRSLERIEAQGDRIMASVDALNERVGELEAQSEAFLAAQVETVNTLNELVALVQSGGGSPDQATIDALTDRLTALRDKNQATLDALNAGELGADPTP